MLTYTQAVDSTVERVRNQGYPPSRATVVLAARRVLKSDGASTDEIRGLLGSVVVGAIDVLSRCDRCGKYLPTAGGCDCD